MENKRSNIGGLVGGALLVAFGLLALAGQVFRVVNWGFLWPFVIIGFGILFFVGMVAGGKKVAALAIPGSIITGLGLVLFVLNTIDHWEAMSYFWTLIVLFVGVGLYIMGIFDRTESRKQAGIGVMKVGGILFLIFGTFFEMIFSGFRPYSVSGIVFPALLMITGIYLILSRSGILGKKESSSTAGSDELPPTS